MTAAEVPATAERQGPWLFAELQRAADEYEQMPDYAKPIKTDPDALFAGSDQPGSAARSTRHSVVDGNHCSSEMGVHPFAPGIDVDDPTNPDPRWCNVCGEAVADA